MKKLLKFLGLRPKTKDLKTIAKEQLQKHMEIFESLRDYDAGKKDISTNNVRKYLPGIRVTPR